MYFLGGTCNESTWRDSLIKLLKVKYFNPVVENWNEDAIKIEEIVKNNASAPLYVITPKQTGFYGLVEAVISTLHVSHINLQCWHLLRRKMD